MTLEKLETNGQGCAALRGFKGKYDITVEAEGLCEQTTLSLTKNGQKLTVRLNTEI